jgi:hypothetical protein
MRSIQHFRGVRQSLRGNFQTAQHPSNFFNPLPWI